MRPSPRSPSLAPSTSHNPPLPPNGFKAWIAGGCLAATLTASDMISGKLKPSSQAMRRYFRSVTGSPYLRQQLIEAAGFGGRSSPQAQLKDAQDDHFTTDGQGHDIADAHRHVGFFHAVAVET